MSRGAGTARDPLPPAVCRRHASRSPGAERSRSDTARALNPVPGRVCLSLHGKRSCDRLGAGRNRSSPHLSRFEASTRMRLPPGPSRTKSLSGTSASSTGSPLESSSCRVRMRTCGSIASAPTSTRRGSGLTIRAGDKPTPLPSSGPPASTTPRAALANAAIASARSADGGPCRTVCGELELPEFPAAVLAGAKCALGIFDTMAHVFARSQKLGQSAYPISSWHGGARPVAAARSRRVPASARGALRSPRRRDTCGRGPRGSRPTRRSPAAAGGRPWPRCAHPASSTVTSMPSPEGSLA